MPLRRDNWCRHPDRKGGIPNRLDRDHAPRLAGASRRAARVFPTRSDLTSPAHVQCVLDAPLEQHRSSLSQPRSDRARQHADLLQTAYVRPRLPRQAGRRDAPPQGGTVAKPAASARSSYRAHGLAMLSRRRQDRLQALGSECSGERHQTKRAPMHQPYFQFSYFSLRNCMLQT